MTSLLISTTTLIHMNMNSDIKSFKLQNCDCDRKLENNRSIESPIEYEYNKTTCGHDSFERGGGQKVIGFSFYEHDNNGREGRIKEKENGENITIPGYFDGIKLNLRLAKQFYPGWVVRLYTDLTSDDPLREVLCDYSCHNDHLDLCIVDQIPTPKVVKLFPMIWRFLPTLDPQVDFYVSRDLDSKFTEREEAAVNEWLESGKAIHSMRDNPYHHIPLLGAGWGARMDEEEIRNKWVKSWEDIFGSEIAYSSRKGKGPDQSVLSMFVWPWAKENSIQHDSYTCRSYSGSIGFPTERKNEPYNFIAAVGPMRLWQECPVECRREGHQDDWKYC